MVWWKVVSLHSERKKNQMSHFVDMLRLLLPLMIIIINTKMVSYHVWNIRASYSARTGDTRPSKHMSLYSVTYCLRPPIECVFVNLNLNVYLCIIFKSVIYRPLLTVCIKIVYVLRVRLYILNTTSSKNWQSHKIYAISSLLAFLVACVCLCCDCHWYCLSSLVVIVLHFHDIFHNTVQTKVHYNKSWILSFFHFHGKILCFICIYSDLSRISGNFTG